MRELKHILEFKYLYRIIVVCCLSYAFIINNYVEFNSKYKLNENKFILIVDKIKITDNKLSMDVIGKEKLKLVYYFKDIKEISNIELGDQIKVVGKLEEPINNTVFNCFNYKEYLYNNHIFYILKAKKIEKVRNNISLIYDVRKKIDNRLGNAKKSYAYLKTFILGDKSNMDDIKDTYYSLGISHLFSISGMHISLLSGILLFLLNRISYNKFYNYLVVVIFLIIYAIIIDFPVSVLRTIVMFILFSLRDLFNLKIKAIDVMFLVLSVCLLIDSFFIYNIVFIYSYVISFSLIDFSKNIKSINNILYRGLYLSYICFLVSFPICIYNYSEINLITILINVVVIPFVSMIIFPMTLVTFIFPCLDSLLYFFISILEFISILVNKITIGKIIFAKPNIIVVFIYYILIYLVIKNRKFIVLFLIVIIIHKNIIYFNNYNIISFLDVGQGDSSLIVYSNNRLNLLIDTGGIYNSNYNIVDNKIIPYMKSLGISKLNYLILSHGDYDHMGEAINLVENFRVEKVIFNCGEFNDLEHDLIKVLNKKKNPYYACIKELNIDNNKLYFLQTKEYDNENDNSNVIYTEIDGYKFMFMGDASITTEKEILKKYNLPDIDVLKVGHHGSKTSSSSEFIDKINPKYSIISVGKNNRYGHPNEEVLNNLDNSKIYRTDQDGSIMFKIKNNKLQIETCSP